MNTISNISIHILKEFVAPHISFTNAIYCDILFKETNECNYSFLYIKINDIKIYNSYQKCLSIINNSSIEFSSFMNYLDNISLSETIDISQLTAKSLDINHINNTFYIIQFLANYTKCEINILKLTNVLLEYCKTLFVTKHNIIENLDFITSHEYICNLFINLKTKFWYKSCINIYYLYENMMVFNYKKSKVNILYNNLDKFDLYLYHNQDIHCIRNTIAYLVYIVRGIDSKYIKDYRCYFSYEVLRMLLIVHSNDNNNELFIKNKNFIEKVKKNSIHIKKDLKKNGMLQYRFRRFANIMIKTVNDIENI